MKLFGFILEQWSLFVFAGFNISNLLTFVYPFKLSELMSRVKGFEVEKDHRHVV
jgi:hypothetical protein